MDLLLRLVAIAATLVFLAATALMLLTFRRARRVTTASLLVPVLVSAAILVLYCVFLRATPSAGWLVDRPRRGGGARGDLGAHAHPLPRPRRRRPQPGEPLVPGRLGRRPHPEPAGRCWPPVTPRPSSWASSSSRPASPPGTAWRSCGGSGSCERALALGLAALGSGAGADDVLLLLPREFDVKPVSGWYRNRSESRRFTAKDLEGDPNPFRFRGEEVTQEHSTRRRPHGQTTARWRSATTTSTGPGSAAAR